MLQEKSKKRRRDVKMDGMVMKTPDTLEELTKALKDADKDTYLISGGTDLIIKFRKDRIYTGTVIDLKGIKELRYIKEEDGCIKIGAGTTFTEIADNRLVQKHAACLVQGVCQIGSTQIRNVATIGGNVANAFAGADGIPGLMAMDAKVKVINAQGETYVKEIERILLGGGKNSLRPDEVIIEIIIPILGQGYKSAFAKVGSRSRVTIAKMNIAAVVKVNEANGMIEDARIVLGALGSKAFHSSLVENILMGKKISEDLAAAFVDGLTEQVDLAIPGRKSRSYKREAIKGLGDEIYHKLFEKTGSEAECPRS